MKKFFRFIKSNIFLWCGIGLVVIYWIIESVSHIIIFGETDLLQQVFHPDMHETWMRFTTSIFIVIGSIIIQFFENRRIFTKRRINHINLVLRAIRSVNKLITREKNRDKLIETSCKNLVAQKGYYNIWIALLNESGELNSIAESGLDKSFSDIVKKMKKGMQTTCEKKALSEIGVQIIKNPKSECIDCPLSSNYTGRGAFSTRLVHNGKIYGFMTASIQKNMVNDEDEKNLFQEIAKDIAYALNSIDEEEKRNLTEKKLYESEKKFRNLVNNINVGIYRNTVGAKGKFIEANPAIIKMFGYKSKNDFLATNVANLYQKPEDRESYNEQMLEKGYVRDKELYLKKNDGTTFIGSVSAVVVKDKKRKIQYYDGIIEDITKRKHAEERFRLAAEAVSDLIYEWNIRNDTLDWFGGFDEALGYSPGSIPRTIEGWINLIHPEDMYKLKDSVEKHRISKSLIQEEYRVKHKDGSWCYWVDKGLPVLDINGKPYKWIGACIDITKRRRAEEQIKKNLKEKEVMIQEIHHRVKNNLQIIISLLDLQEDNIHNKDQAVKAISDSKNRIFAMAQVHERLYKSEDLSEVDMQSYIENISAELMRYYGNRELIEMKIDVKDISLNINKAIPCGLIINEAITNSMKHAFQDNQKGTINVNFKRMGNNNLYQMKISDNGIGLPQNIDIKNSETLGLKLIDILTDQLRGKIDIKRDKGTTLQITFEM